MSTVVVVGSGGREHAIARALQRSSHVSRVVLAPGNPGMPTQWERWTVAGAQELATRCKNEGVSLVFIGPDQPLADGWVDVLEAQGIVTFGPRRAAARLEWSKAFAKEVMQAAGVPTAAHFVERGIDAAKARLRALPWPTPGWVVKADGLALGKGVVVCAQLEEALGAIDELASQGHSEFVIEERLSGEEVSWMAFCDGSQAVAWEPARDFKRIGENDAGANTGGMGALSPVPGIPEAWRERVTREVFESTLREMRARGCEFRGLLYAGLMVNRGAERPMDQIRVIEFNSRLGDPEAQVLLDRLEGDLYEWARACALGRLAELPARELRFAEHASVIVVGAAPGYPAAPVKGARLPNWDARQDHAPRISAGITQDSAGAYRVSGGRVLGVLGRGTTLEQARRAAYAELETVRFEGMQARRDIAWREAAPSIAILASGRGSNCEAILRAIEARTLRARITQVLTDQPTAGVIALARARALAVSVVQRGARSREEHDQEILRALDRDPPRWLVLAGYMRLLSPALIERYRDPRGYTRIVNVHPSLLPSYKGLHAYAQAYEAGARRTGVTVHLVTPELDAGPVCAQESFDIEDCESVEEVERLGLAIEHRLYPQTLSWLLEEQFTLRESEGATRVLPN